VPDEFPTLEVVALLGVLTALLRALSLWSALRTTPELAQSLTAALRARDPVKARAICERAEGAAFASLVSALLDELRQNPTADRETLERAARAAYARAAHAVRRGRARDLAALALLVGAVAYAFGSPHGLGVGPIFYTLSVVGLVLLAMGPLLRWQNLRLLEAWTDRLVEAASAKGERASLSSVGPCPECGSGDELAFTPVALSRLAEFGVTELSACSECGALWGSVADPEALARKSEFVTRLSGGEVSDEDAADPDEEHEG
jgi:hypothetical protein